MRLFNRRPIILEMDFNIEKEKLSEIEKTLSEKLGRKVVILIPGVRIVKGYGA